MVMIQYDSLGSVFRENGRSRETVFRAIVEKIFLPWDLRLGPAVRPDFHDPSGTNGFDNLVGLKIDLNATAAQGNFALLLGDFNNRSVGCHMTWAVVAGSVFQGIFRTVDLTADIIFEIVVECLIHAAEKRRDAVACPNFPYLTSLTNAGNQRVRMKLLCFWV